MSVVMMNNDSDSTGSSTAATDIEDDEGNGDNNESDDDICVIPFHDCSVADNDTSTMLVLNSDDTDSGDRNAHNGAVLENNNSKAMTVAKCQVIQQLKEKIGMLQEWNLTLTREIKRMRHKESSADKEKEKKKASQTAVASFQDELLGAINGVTERHN
jgi:hypothetical protein